MIAQYVQCQECSLKVPQQFLACHQLSCKPSKTPTSFTTITTVENKNQQSLSHRNSWSQQQQQIQQNQQQQQQVLTRHSQYHSTYKNMLQDYRCQYCGCGVQFEDITSHTKICMKNQSGKQIWNNDFQNNSLLFSTNNSVKFVQSQKSFVNRVPSILQQNSQSLTQLDEVIEEDQQNRRYSQDAFQDEQYELYEMEDDEQDINSNQNSGLSQEQIDSFRICYYREQQQGKFEEKQCTICYCEFQEGEETKFLDCFHRFHAQCIDLWLCKNKLCPVCKFNQEQ